jgi:hypothetical protein
LYPQQFEVLSMPTTILKREKGSRVHYATAVSPEGHVSGWSEEKEKAASLTEELAEKVGKRLEAKRPPGRYSFLDAKGKVLGSMGEAGTDPKPVVPKAPDADLADRVAELEAAVELIQEADRTVDVADLVRRIGVLEAAVAELSTPKA